ncbi:hypothetical protein TNCV_1273001 [Trichonephila clavipes]|nr:hypothetical protein TNCV_1273001 [Trichonephila clavipes]
MTSKKTGKDMPLFLITMDKTEENKAAYHVTEIGYMKVTIESLRPKYGPPQCFRCQGFSTPADSALALPDASSVQEITWQRMHRNPIDQKSPSAVCAKVSTLPVSGLP